MKNFLLKVFTLLVLASISSKTLAQSAGINTSFAVLSINGAANAYYDLQASTPNTDFQGTNLGSFNATNSLLLKGAEHNVYKCGGCDLTSTRLYYRVYLTGSTPGAFSNLNIGYFSGGSNGCGGQDQQWANTGYSTNILSGLSAGNYTFEVYSDASVTCLGGTVFASNSGANYKATFSYCGPTSGALPVGNYAIPGCFATVASAITYINANGVSGTGTVQFDVAAGYTETAPAGGFSITATGTATTAIVFKKSGAGANPTFTANSTLTSGSLSDAIFKIIGGDYITIDGFTMLENANTTTTAASNNMTEWGIALLYASTTNGCQNITLKNNTIDLNRTYQNSFGIYANATHTATAPTSSSSATGTSGGNHNLTITGNTITDVNQGIVVVGPTADADNNDNVVIGGSLSDANTITNFGTTGTFSGYVNVSGTVNGVLVRNSKNANISYNTITSSVGGVTSGTLNGIQMPSSSNVPTGAFTTTLNNNTISLRSGLVGGTIVGIAVPSNSASTTSTIIINNNNFNTFGHTVAAATGAIGFINCASTNQFTTINSNTFTNLSLTTTGSVTFIANSITMPAGGSQTITNNQIVTGFTKTGAGGTVTFITSAGSSNTGTTSLWSLNNFSNVSVTGATTVTAITNTDGGTVNHNITNNTITNITGGTSAITAINSSFGGGGGSLGNVVSGNTINTISSAGAITGIAIGTSGTISSVFNNTINGLTTTGAFAVQGITSGAPTSNSIYQNKIYNLESNNASGTVNGIAVSSGTLHTLYNNIIGDLRTPASNAANPLNGINITGGTTVNAFHNTVRLESVSSGALFGSSAISVSTTPNVTLRNNIFINNSTFTGTGLSVSYRRGSATLTTYNAASDSNIYYAGTPSANNLIFSDGTNFDQTMAAFQSRVAARDTASQTENVSFISTTGSNADFLRIALGTTSFAESGGALVSTPNINTDYWNVTRPFVSPVNGGTAVDIGASEFDGIPNLSSCIAPVNQATAFVAGAVTSNSAQATFTAATSAPTGYLVITSQGAFVGTPVDGTIYSPGATLGNGLVIQSNATTAINAVGLPSNTTGTITIFSYNSGSCAGGPKYNLVTPLTGTNTTCAGPATLPVTNAISASGFTANWTQAALGNAFTITYSVEVTTDVAYTLPIAGSPFTTTSLSQVITGLNPQTNYYWRVKGNNTICDSAYLNAGLVTTDCAAITTFPSTEPFASYLPSTCWKEGDLGDLVAGPATIGAAVSDWGVDGFLNSGTTGAAKMNIDTATGSEWILSPYYTIPAVGYRVKYNVGATQFAATTAPTTAWEADDFVELLVSTSNTNWTVLRTYNSTSVPSHLGQVDESDLTAYNGQTVRFAFRAFEGATDGGADIDFFIDNFTVEVTPVAITASASTNPICSGDSTTLSVSSANTNYAYTWSPATGLSATTGTSVTANPTTTTTYTINAVDGAMVNSTTLTLTVNPSPSALTVSPASATVCENTITTLTATGGTTTANAIIGTGTVVNGTTSYPNPFSSFYGGAKHQMIYLASELTGQGLSTGSSINTVSLNISAFVANACTDMTIRMKNSSSTVLTGFETGTTTVYGPTTFTPSTTGWASFTLSSAFVWDGTSNIIVEFVHNAGNGGNGSGTTVNCSTTTGNKTYYAAKDNVAGGIAGFDAATFTTTGGSTSRPNVRFGYISQLPITWTPITDLYSDAGANTAYSTGQNFATVYHKGATNTYTATATIGICTKTATSTITVNPLPNGTLTNGGAVCSGTQPQLTFTASSGTGPFTLVINGETYTGVVSGTAFTATGTVPTVTTTYSATSIAGVNCTNSSPTVSTSVTVGGSTTWTAGTPNYWSNGAPTSIDTAIISADYSETANLTACSLTVNNNAVVSIPSLTNVSLQGAITVSSGSFTLNNNANLLQSQNVTNSGNIIVKRTTSAIMRQDYVLWSSPVASQQLQAFSPGTLATRFYTYNPSTDLYVVVGSPATTNFADATGYLIRTSNWHPATPATWTGTFTGVPHNGDYSVSVTNGTFNAIGNPYPSTIDADAFITANSLTDPLYLWRKTNSPVTVTSSYATYTTAGGVANTGGGSSLVPNGTIQVGQGFIAKATSSSLNFTNAIRTSNNGDQFFRLNTDKSRVWLNLTNTSGIFSQALVAYMSTATNGVDAAIDGKYLENNITTALSTLINNDEYVIQGRAPFAATDVVPVGFKVQDAGTYTIAIDHVDGLFTNGQEVYLKDNLMNIEHNLSNSAYEFSSQNGVFNSRFEIVYQTNLSTQNPVMNDNNVFIYKKDQDIVVNSGAIEMKSVQVYDIQGRLLVENTNINAKTTKLAVSSTNQVLIVKVTSNDNSVVTKKVIN